MRLKLKNTFSVILCCFVFCAFADSLMGKIAPSQKFNVKKLISDLKKAERNESISTEESHILLLLTFMHESFHLIETQTYIHRKVKLTNVIKEMENLVLFKNGWNTQISDENILSMRKNEKRFLEILGAESISWAWIQKALGNKSVSENLLKTLFEKQYEKTMAMDQAVFGFHGPGPLGYSQEILKYLLDISSKNEQLKLKEKMRKMKLHVSKIPNARILT